MVNLLIRTGVLSSVCSLMWQQHDQKHQSGISRFLICYIYICCEFLFVKTYYVRTDPLLTVKHNFRFPFNLIFLTVDLEIVVVSVGNICNINDLHPYRIPHSFCDSIFIPLKSNAGENFSMAAIFFYFKKYI